MKESNSSYGIVDMIEMEFNNLLLQNWLGSMATMFLMYRLIIQEFFSAVDQSVSLENELNVEVGK